MVHHVPANRERPRACVAVGQQHVYQRNLVCNVDEVRRPGRNEVTRVPRVTQILDEALRLKVEGLGVEEALAEGFGGIVAHPRPQTCDLYLATGVHAHPQLLVPQTVVKL